MILIINNNYYADDYNDNNDDSDDYDDDNYYENKVYSNYCYSAYILIDPSSESHKNRIIIMLKSRGGATIIIRVRGSWGIMGAKKF